MTRELKASRTLVKSPPELWAECSDASALARHLDGCFGEIRITRVEPETTVSWEGQSASGTVEIESSGWGTKVTLTARIAEDPEPEVLEPQPEEAVESEVDPEAPQAVDPEEAPPIEEPRSFLHRLRALWRAPTAADQPAEESLEATSEVELDDASADSRPTPADREPAMQAAPLLSAALDSLGQAHHRPYSRA